MRMIFYYPSPIQENGTSASKIRPYKMLSAFKKIGIEVYEVTGYAKERKEKIQNVKKQVQKGVKFDFTYGENTTLPLLLNEKSHYPTHPLMDYMFFRWLKDQQIPFGLFYRDIYWRFPEFRKNLPIHKWAIPLPFHYLDIEILRKMTTRLFLPSQEMSEFLPGNWNPSKFVALPPGCEEGTYRKSRQQGQNLRFFYVGGVTPPNYDLTPMLQYFSKTEQDVYLTICCREKEWNEVQSAKAYRDYSLDRIAICHKSGDSLKPFWKKADLFLALWGDISYHDFAMPFKIFEAVGYGMPIITTRGTAAGEFVAENGFGWVIEPRSDALSELVQMLKQNPELIEKKREAILARRPYHTWEARARQVIEALCRKDAEL